MRGGILFLCLTVTVAWVPGCSSGDKTSEDFLQLSWVEFDQSLDTGWRPVADGGDRARAAQMIESYLEKKKGLENGQVGYLHLHCGQLWVLEGQDARALSHINKAFVDPYPPRFPQVWNEVVEGTIAFMSQDMEALHAAIAKVHAMGELSPRDSLFLGGLEDLAKMEGTPYAEVLESWIH